MNTDELISRVVDDLIEKKGLGKLDNEKKGELKEKLSEHLIKRINVAILQKLPDDKFDEFEKMAQDENADYGKAQELVADSGIDFSEILKTTIEQFRRAFLDLDLDTIKGKAEA